MQDAGGRQHGRSALRPYNTERGRRMPARALLCPEGTDLAETN
jgi:hypothetical protein